MADHGKRVSGGFIGTATGSAMTAIQSIKPQWFGDHSWILPVSLLVLMVSLLYWLSQYRWFQYVLGIREESQQENSQPWKTKDHWRGQYEAERSKVSEISALCESRIEALNAAHAREIESLDLQLQHWQNPWRQYESEEVWKQSIAEQNRLIELGRSIDGKLNPIQVEILETLSTLRNLLSDLGALPDYNPSPNLTVEGLSAKLSEYNTAIRIWSTKADARYRLEAANKIDQIRLKISASDIDKPIQAHADLWSIGVLSAKIIATPDDLEKIIDALESIFFNVR